MWDVADAVGVIVGAVVVGVIVASRAGVPLIVVVASAAPYTLRFGESIMMPSTALAKATHLRQPMIALLSYENA